MKIVLFLLSVALLQGCVFAPEKFGSRAIVRPGNCQYEAYLENCRSMSPELDSYCIANGKPYAIKIGHSGGLFAWYEPLMMISVKSFGYTRVIHKVSGDILTVMMHDAKARSESPVLQARYDNYQTRMAGGRAAIEKVQSEYSIEEFKRNADDLFSYSFTLRVNQSKSDAFQQMSTIKENLRSMIAKDYNRTYGGSISEVHVDFPEFSLKGPLVKGTASVMHLAVQSLKYNPLTQKGVLAVKIGSSRFEDAREYVRKNIATLARDKNITLTSTEIPPPARFFLGAEHLRDGNILEIEFETE